MLLEEEQRKQTGYNNSQFSNQHEGILAQKSVAGNCAVKTEGNVFNSQYKPTLFYKLTYLFSLEGPYSKILACLLANQEAGFSRIKIEQGEK